ncbi:T-lymphocyte activation antigen CD86 [Perognathus longimembris pacificus]|uniref:T-lymphocyte activation antigen CD86 n=1 Tax=Perognathus longimembris pacificus TaxID=214514 RepID=UPI00201A19DD|nr:T-lymphocyte activation antigen CD86 [Perognathus longimembris pacificus]
MDTDDRYGLKKLLTWKGMSFRAMGLRLALLVIAAFLFCGAASLKIQAYFNETAELPCPFVNSKNLSLDDLVVFWQDQENLVLYEKYAGKDKSENVNANYIGRTSFDQDKWILRLHGIQIKDKGVYQCFVHQRKTPGGMVHVYKNSCELSVIANFSKPEIKQNSNITRYSPINVTCSSNQGYPKPLKMFFQLVTENSTSSHVGNMLVSQDNVTELYNLSLSLSVPFPDGAVNVTISCILQTESRNLSSLPLYIIDSMNTCDYTENKLIISFMDI